MSFGQHEPGMPLRRRSRWWWLGPLASLVIFAASLVVLWHIVREIEPGELGKAFANASLRQIGLALAFTALSYLLLTGYDALALKRLGLSIPYRTTALASFTSYSVSFTLGFPIVTGGTVRYWIYSPKGVRASEVASLTVIAGLTFWLGLGAILCASLFYDPAGVARLARVSPLVVQGIGAAIALATLGYLFWIASGERTVRVRGWNLPLHHARPDGAGRQRGLRGRRRALRAAARRPRPRLSELSGGLCLRLPDRHRQPRARRPGRLRGDHAGGAQQPAL
jgi:uncharacterized membrane protein YbhN (UPF0104 family)